MMQIIKRTFEDKKGGENITHIKLKRMKEELEN